MKNPIDNAIAKIDAEIATLNNVRARLEVERNAVTEEPAPKKERKARKKRGMPAADVAASAAPEGKLI